MCELVYKLRVCLQSLFVAVSVIWAIVTMVVGVINTYYVEVKGGEALRAGIEFVHALWTLMTVAMSGLLRKLHDKTEADSFLGLGLEAKKCEFHFVDTFLLVCCNAFFLPGLVVLGWAAFVWPIGGGEWAGVDTRVLRNVFLIAWGLVPMVLWFRITEMWNGQEYVRMMKHRHAAQLRSTNHIPSPNP